MPRLASAWTLNSLRRPYIETVILNEGFESGSSPWSFSATSTAGGTISIITAASPEGSKYASFASDTTVQNKFSRVQHNLAWVDGVIYETEFWLKIPTGTLAACQGPIQIVGHDPFPQLNNHSRLMYDTSNSTWRMYYKTNNVDANLTANPGFTLVENQWLRVKIGQRITASSDGYTNVWVDGTLVASGTGANLYDTGGNGITRMRYGLVAEAGTTQTNALTILMDDIELRVLSTS